MQMSYVIVSDGMQMQFSDFEVLHFQGKKNGRSLIDITLLMGFPRMQSLKLYLLPTN